MYGKESLLTLVFHFRIRSATSVNYSSRSHICHLTSKIYRVSIFTLASSFQEIRLTSHLKLFRHEHTPLRSPSPHSFLTAPSQLLNVLQVHPIPTASLTAMLRRPPTSIPITPDDLAIFEKQYAQGQIYADHHQRSNIGNGWTDEHDHGFETPPSSMGEGQMNGNPGAAGHEGGEERRVKTRRERILGAAGGGVGGGAAAASATTGGHAGSNGGTVAAAASGGEGPSTAQSGR